MTGLIQSGRVGLLACVAAVGLSACSGEREHARVNAGMCADFSQPKTAAPAVGAADGAGAVDECVKRWAYSLASARDSADEVAEAVVGACSTQLSRWNQQTLNQPDGGGGEAASILTGQPTTPIAEHLNFTRARAMLYVVQARAGRCTPPKAVNGVPEGVG